MQVLFWHFQSRWHGGITLCRVPFPPDISVLEKTEKEKTKKSQPTHKRDVHFQGPQTKGETFCVDRMPSATRRGGGHPLGPPPPSLWLYTPHQTTLWSGVEALSYLDHNAALPLIILQASVAFTEQHERRCPRSTIFRSFLLAF